MTEEVNIPNGYKFCQCGCKSIIPIINKKGKQARFKHGHNAVGEMNNFYGQTHSRDKSARWKGGRFLTDGGYVRILRPHHIFCSKQGYVLEHRYFMELELGRYLTKSEVVHHIDGNVRNNSVDNLILFESNGKHLSETLVKDMSNRCCLLCKSTTTYFRKDKKVYCWFRYLNGFICRKCSLKNIKKWQNSNMTR